ncbi:hypothetical protein PLICRDRAFT_86909 [Plicaturopsis crispa FD-325 SS-3]|nr:hypothetical protein PLICRDRAFT_86909 [Plicaturopsis crispa FD-325 SS-3]
MVFEYRRQPIRGIYLAYQLVVTLLVWIPLWTLISLPRPLRPRRSWPVRRCLMVRLLRHGVHVSSRVGTIRKSPNHLALCQGPDIKGLWIPPTPELITGDLSYWVAAADVQPVPIPGYWIDRPGMNIPMGQAPMPCEKVVYCLHGGAYTQGSASPNLLTSAIAYGLLDHLKPVQRAFSIEYRLSAAAPYEPANPFPAALLDALAGYHYLVNTVGFDPADIIIEGDSAGGNLALALTRYLIENGKNLAGISLPGPPGALILLSPWCDLGTSHEFPGSSTMTLHVTDYLNPNLNGYGTYAKRAFAGIFGGGAMETSRYISPASLRAHAKFVGWPRAFISAGGAEMLRDQIRTLKDKMRADMGEGAVAYEEEPDAVHDYLVFKWQEPDRTNTLRAIGKWVDSLDSI